MTWWEGVDKTRVLIAPDSVPGGENLGHLLRLQHPKSGNGTCYLLINGMLQELNWFKQSYGSWFLGDYISEDGSLYMASPVDPVFIMLPIFEKARMKKGEDPGKFRPLDEIIFVDGYPGYQNLVSLAESCMQVVCETKEIGGTKFYRLDDSKVLAWLDYKVCQLKRTLPMLDQNYAAWNEKEALTNAVSILGEYMNTDPWLKLLCDYLRLDILEATLKESGMENLPTVKESNPESSNPSQEKKNQGKPARGGKQMKKPKVEPESRNIREMFSRACKRKS